MSSSLTIIYSATAFRSSRWDKWRDFLGTFLILAVGTFILFTFYYSIAHVQFLVTPLFSLPYPRSTCPPLAYANGAWIPRSQHTNKTHISEPSNALDFAGFGGCASSREINWHLGVDVQEQWDRFEHPGHMDWEWKVDDDICLIELLESEKLLRHLIRDGGWLLLGGKSDTMSQSFVLKDMLMVYVRFYFWKPLLFSHACYTHM